MDANRSMRFQCGWSLKSYRKIPKISLGAYIFQRPFLRALFLEGFIFGGAYRLGKPYSWKEIYRFCFVLLCIWGQFSKYKPPGGLYLEGRFNGGFLRYRFGGLIFGGAYTWRGLFSEFYGMSFLDGNAKENSGSCCYNYFFPSFFFLT